MKELNEQDRERIEQAKNEVALKNGWNDWDSLVIWHRESGLMEEVIDYIDEVVAEYENKYQRERMAELTKENERLRERERQLVEALGEFCDAVRSSDEKYTDWVGTSEVYDALFKAKSLLNNQPDEK